MDRIHARARLRNAVERLSTAVERLDTIRGSHRAWHVAANAIHQIADLLYDVVPPDLEKLSSNDPDPPESDH